MQLKKEFSAVRGDNIIPIPGTKRRKYLEENAKSVAVELEAINELSKKYLNIGSRYAVAENKFVKKD